jgi:hypothetical protein
MIGREALDYRLDTIELSDAVERFLGDRRAGGSMHVEEFASDMRPTASLGNPVAREQLVEAGIAVSMDDAGEFLQVGPWMLALAIGRVAEQCCRRSRTAKRPLVTT